MNNTHQIPIAIVSEMVGELVAFWGFKTSMGRVWSLLYLSSSPLTADVISEQTGLSTGAVSMALSEMTQWGVVSRVQHSAERKRHYQAETNIWGIVRGIVRKRELPLVGRAVEQFERALTHLKSADQSDPETLFLIRRVQGLLTLARRGYTLVETFAELGQLSLKPIQGVLSWAVKSARAG